MSQQIPSTLIPAYGCDYPSAPFALAAYYSGADFLIADISNPWNGKPCSIRDFPPGTQLCIRYNKLRSIVQTGQEPQS